MLSCISIFTSRSERRQKETDLHQIIYFIRIYVQLLYRIKRYPLRRHISKSFEPFVSSSPSKPTVGAPEASERHRRRRAQIRRWCVPIGVGGLRSGGAACGGGRYRGQRCCRSADRPPPPHAAVPPAAAAHVHRLPRALQHGAGNPPPVSRRPRAPALCRAPGSKPTKKKSPAAADA